jgi:rhodanese-related sulfurtransferase
MNPRPRRSVPALTIALLLAALASCCHDSTGSSISQTELAQRIGSDHAPLIIDVRSRREFDSGHIPGAVNIPHGELIGRLDELGTERDREIVVYCEGGGRSTTATYALLGAGFSTVLRLEGDMSAWRASRLQCVGC